MLTRRRFLRRSLEAGLAAASPIYIGTSVTGCARAESAAPGSSDVLVNHVGFTPDAAKFCVLAGTRSTPFNIVERGSTHVVHQGTLAVRQGDLGDFLVADFTDLKQSGQYELQVGNRPPAAFAIANNVYGDGIAKCTGYFAKQRCGDSQTGHHAPCHLDDGRRSDNGQHQDTSGGWHDACDLRKWVDATIYGMIGLSRVLDLVGPKSGDRQRIIDEMRWGNAYFLKMQEPDGFVMDYCGGDDGNRYTDNQMGTGDDRAIHVDPCILPAQFHFIAAQAAIARHVRDIDVDDSKACESAAERCLDWCVKNRSPGAATSLAAAIIACVELHRTTNDDRLSDLAADFASRLLSLQVTSGNGDDPTGFFNAAPDRPEPSREIQHGNLPLIALCEAIEHFKGQKNAERWRQALRLHCV
jgi:hypothetical protein